MPYRDEPVGEIRTPTDPAAELKRAKEGLLVIRVPIDVVRARYGPPGRVLGGAELERVKAALEQELKKQDGREEPVTAISVTEVPDTKSPFPPSDDILRKEVDGESLEAAIRRRASGSELVSKFHVNLRLLPELRARLGLPPAKPNKKPAPAPALTRRTGWHFAVIERIPAGELHKRLQPLLALLSEARGDVWAEIYVGDVRDAGP
ncbi:MAG: hypothetical protein M1598_03745 [Actinobacteria bacterium]|nr:hypothetical protein [Actinomycetota bacterium]